MSGFQQPKKFALLLGHHEVKLWTVQNIPRVSDMQTGLSAGNCDASRAGKDFDHNPVSHEDRLLQRQDAMLIGPRARIAWLVVGAYPSAAEQSAGEALPGHTSACFLVEEPWRGSFTGKHTVGHRAISNVQDPTSIRAKGLAEHLHPTRGCAHLSDIDMNLRSPPSCKDQLPIDCIGEP